VSEAIQISQSS
jgi:hypothetical protein